ncbi:MAG TPA: hypothetical protein VN688_04415 [Gemmataceae bacterium]|nr:hypothetical protein [Gemmataceae bacterium]
MKNLSAHLLTAAIVLLAAIANPARADYLNWTYTSTPSVPGVTVGAQSASGGATVQLTDFNNAASGLSIPVIAYSTSTGSTTPLAFDPANSTYTLALKITDNTTHDTGTLTFNGSIGGNLSATASTLTNTLTSVSPSLTLDGHVYTVTIPSVALAPPTSPQQNIFATVSVSNVIPGGPPTGDPHGPSSTPEPASLVLGSLGFSCLGLTRWWNRYRRSEEPTA